jgi:RimJ/RimL family protein N-acetyltransferase
MKVFLRAFNISDYEKIYPWLLNNENQKLTGGNTYYASIDYVRKWVEGKIFDSKDHYFAICLCDTLEIIGYTSINEMISH